MASSLMNQPKMWFPGSIPGMSLPSLASLMASVLIVVVTASLKNSLQCFSAIELNPLAVNEMTKFMESEALNDLIDQLMIEVSLIDL